MGKESSNGKTLGAAKEVPGWEERRRRVERLFMAATMQVHPHGSKAWLARIIGVWPKTVRRWCVPTDREESRTPEPEMWAEVENMEKDVGRDRLAKAEKKLVAYYEQNPDTANEWEKMGR